MEHGGAAVSFATVKRHAGGMLNIALMESYFVICWWHSHCTAGGSCIWCITWLVLCTFICHAGGMMFTRAGGT